MGGVVLHPRDLAGCEHRLALDFAHPDQRADRTDTPDTARRKEAAADHRTAVREMLRGVHSDQPPGTWQVIVGASHQARVDATLAACRDGVEWIWNATLPTERGRRGHAELLVRVDGGYVPVIVVNHRVSYPTSAAARASGGPTVLTSPVWTWAPQVDSSRSARNQRRDLLRLAQLTTMMSDLGLTPSDDPTELKAGIIGIDADCIVVHAMGPVLADYEQVFDRRIAIAEQLIATIPRRIGECRSCPWWERCGPDLERRRDVSLVVGGNQSSALFEIGVNTIDQLAAYRGAPPPNWPGNARFSDAVVLAMAWLTDTKLVRRVEEPTVARADVEVDVDMESYGESGAYLWGTLLTDTTDPMREVRYRPFVTWDPLPTRDEGRSFGEFWTWLIDERDKATRAGKTFAAYCYSQQAENRWLLSSTDRFAGDPGVPTRTEVQQFIDSDEWVDIFEAVGRNFICPLGKGLKRVAPVAGFRWRDDEASGEASMDWYRLAVALDGGSPDLGQRERLLEYNEDDVRATKVLREWMDGPARDEVPYQDSLLALRD
ncbi:TM0106 family RecB-like putative nuclease [Gordonia soli]|uniref:YprB ribonuclease H-like domain-containing protein n=1 Tax=Gordonia soli NBRC 108243 TaxID=1223545 RepID=M0QLK5_9ACTN|nr:TM0106 family RecB-like putative nuclease [Gordonia soli]GAC69299.1 hypothetical protein GS4_23_00960 [Gordonia soli NBRC 108243]